VVETQALGRRNLHRNDGNSFVVQAVIFAAPK
jgi:hypothetical protein